MKYYTKLIIMALALIIFKNLPLMAQTKPLRIEISQGVIEPMPIALSKFMAVGDISVKYSEKISHHRH